MKHKGIEKKLFFYIIIIILIIIISIFMIFIKNKNNQKDFNSNINNNISSSISNTSSISNDEIARQIKEIDNKLDDPLLRLITKELPLNSNYLPELITINNLNKQVDKRILNDLNKMLSDGKKANINLYIQSAYRSYNVQKTLYENKINNLLPKYDNDNATATIEAGKIVAPPGTSEHQYGMSLDIVEKSVSSLVPEVEEKTATYKWLYKNCANYGFILRYPKNKTDITGIMYEPWHFRYVGIENAKTIMSLGITLEEYIEQLLNEKNILEEKNKIE